MTYERFLLFVRFQTTRPDFICAGQWAAMINQAKLNGDIVDES